MNKFFKKILSLSFIFSICACGNEKISSSSITSTNSHLPKNEVEELFYQLTQNNFSVDFSDSFFDLGNKVRNEKFYYTEYSLQAEGDFGFSGIAQGNDLIFKYTLEGKDVVSGIPMINPSNGVRYETIFDYTYGMNNFEYWDMDLQKNDNGYYIYEFGKNHNNDRLIMPILLREGPHGLAPEELKFKITKDVITFEATILSYDFDDDGVLEGKDTVTSIVYDIGKTENPEIKKFLADGKTSKTPLDLRFTKLIHPFMFSQNYSIDLDGTDMYDGFKFTEYLTEDALYLHGENTNAGYVLNQGVVCQFNVINDKINITSTPQADENTYYTSIYGQLISYTFNDLSYNDLVGYKDDDNDNIYYLTDNKAMQTISSLCYNEIHEESYCDRIKIEIINDSTHEFIMYFDFYNKLTNRNIGTLEARVYNLNNTTIKPVSDYLSLGDNPNTQTKENLQNVLNKLSKHNYSMDFNTGYGVAKYYYTENYMYAEIYGRGSNFGFIKVNESIYEFKIVEGVVTIDYDIDYAALDNHYSLPGHSNNFMAADDFGYISTISDELYNMNNYSISSTYGQDYWSINNVPLANKIFNYYIYSGNSYLPTGVGLLCRDDGDNSKLSFYMTFTSSNGQEVGYSYLSYYDIGTTSYKILDDYLATL